MSWWIRATRNALVALALACTQGCAMMMVATAPRVALDQVNGPVLVFKEGAFLVVHVPHYLPSSVHGIRTTVRERMTCVILSSKAGLIEPTPAIVHRLNLWNRMHAPEELRVYWRQPGGELVLLPVRPPCLNEFFESLYPPPIRSPDSTEAEFMPTSSPAPSPR